MFTRATRSLVALVLLLAAGTASADWKAEVGRQGFWAPKLTAEGWNRIFHANPAEALGQLPQGVQTMLRTEVEDNPWTSGHEEMATKLGRFRPEAREVFDLPYIPIPADAMKHNYMDPAMSAQMREHVRYTENGREMVRFFFHPLYADKYDSLIEKYGARYGEYWATSTSSPRSLIVWKRDQPNRPIWVKVSVHANIDYYLKKDRDGTVTKVGISRVQTEKKANRSKLVNEAFSSATQQELDRNGVSFMPEPASFVPGDIQVGGRRVGFDRATIFRELPETLTRMDAATRWVPAFAFIKGLKQLSETTRIQPLQLATKGLIEPLVRTYLYLGLEHGLQGELHTQNFLVEVDRRGLPTGKVMVKDLDGFRMDLDMRVRNGRDLRYLNSFTNPFEWAKHSATQGSNDNPAVLQGWFNKLIRNVNGFTTTRGEKTVYATPAGQLMERFQEDFPQIFAQMRRAAIRRDASLANESAEAVDRKAIEQVFDRVAQRQFQVITGIKINWANWGFGQDKGLNNGLNTLRQQLFAAQPGVDADAAQGVLRDYWGRARTNNDLRLWPNAAKPAKFRYLGDGVIQGLGRNGQAVGMAILKSEGESGMAGLHQALQQAGVQAPQRIRAPHHLANYAATNQVAPSAFRESPFHAGPGNRAAREAGQGGGRRGGVVGAIRNVAERVLNNR